MNMGSFVLYFNNIVAILLGIFVIFICIFSRNDRYRLISILLKKLIYLLFPIQVVLLVILVILIAK